MGTPDPMTALSFKLNKNEPSYTYTSIDQHSHPHLHSLPASFLVPRVLCTAAHHGLSSRLPRLQASRRRLPMQDSPLSPSCSSTLCSLLSLSLVPERNRRFLCSCQCPQILFLQSLTAMICCYTLALLTMSQNYWVEQDNVEHISSTEPEMFAIPTESGKPQEMARCPECKICVWSYVGFPAPGHVLTLLLQSIRDRSWC